MENSLVLHNSFPVIKNFATYKSYVLNIPNLSEKEERDLLVKFKVENSLKSAQTLILSQLKTVIYIAQQFKNYGLSEEDLVQEGNIGLMKAVKNYDLTHKVRLYTYALLWIKAEIQNYVLRNWRIVKIGTTKNLKKLFFNFRQIQKEMIDLGIPKSKIEELVAKKLNVPEEEIKEIEGYFSNTDTVIDLSNDNEEDSPILQLTDGNTPENSLMVTHDAKIREKIMNDLLKNLSERQQEVIKMRFFNEEKKTHKEIAKLLKVSSERVRQIEMESMKKLKNILEKKYNIQEAF